MKIWATADGFKEWNYARMNSWQRSSFTYESERSAFNSRQVQLEPIKHLTTDLRSYKPKGFFKRLFSRDA